jgi:hypothetical protein
LLFSSATDPIVNVSHKETDEKLMLMVQVWCTTTFRHLYALWSPYDAGDIFCVAYSSHHRTVYLGAQNTSIQVHRKLQVSLYSADSDSGTISKKKTPDLHPLSPRIPPNERIASSTRLARAAYKHRSPAAKTVDPKMRWEARSCRSTARTYTNLHTMDMCTACFWGRASYLKRHQKKC